MTRLLLSFFAAITTAAGLTACEAGPVEPSGQPEGAAEGHVDARVEPPDRVRLSAAALERSGIELALALGGRIGEAVVIPAEVQLDPGRVAHISPLVDGQLSSVEVALGDDVTAGQDLARLRSVVLGQARAELRRTQALLRVAEKTLAREVRLRAEGINAERKLIEAQLAHEQAKAEHEAARSRLSVFGVRGGAGPSLSLDSPIAGRIVERHATRGENVSSEDTLFVVADLSRVWVIGRVYERQIPKVQEGMRARVTLDAYPGRSWAGQVDYVGATLDPLTRSLPLRVEVDNPQGRLRPGLFGRIHVAEGAGGDGVLVPEDALQSVGGRTVVFVPGAEEGIFVARPVTVSRRGSREVEIARGLEAGERIVVRGAFVLKSELMRGALGHGHAH